MQELMVLRDIINGVWSLFDIELHCFGVYFTLKDIFLWVMVGCFLIWLIGRFFSDK